MSDQAKVSSLDAVDSFRTSLLIFIEKAGKALDEVGDAVRRTKYWVQEEQPNHYRMEKRRAERKLEQAEQELYSSRIQGIENVDQEAQMMVRRARARLQEIDAKMRMIKKWGRDYDSEVEPLARRMDTLADLISTKYPKAVSQLSEMIRILEEYAQVGTAGPAPTETSEGEAE